MFEVVSLRPLVWLLTLVAAAIGLRYTLVDRPIGLRLASWAFRAAAIALLVVALCRPFAADHSDQLHVNLLVDVSQSVDLKHAIDGLSQIDQWIGNLRNGDTWSLYAVAGGVRRFESVEALRSTLTAWSEGAADDDFRSSSQLADALLETRLSFPAGKARRTVLISDGHDTTGNIEQVLDQLDEEGVDVRFAEAVGLEHAEAAVAAIRPASPRAFYGEVMRLEVESAANRPMRARLRIIHKGVAVAEQQVQLDGKQPAISHFDVDLTTPGASQWTAEILPDDDHFPVNNQASCTIHVHGRPRILMLHDNPQELRPFTKAMREQEM